MIELLTSAHEAILAAAVGQGMKVSHETGYVEYIVSDGRGKGIALMNVKVSPDAYEPHMQYFPWATVRQKYRSFLEALDYLRQSRNVIITTRIGNMKWFDAWAKRGKIRKVGFLEKMANGDIHIYQAVKAC